MGAQNRDWARFRIEAGSPHSFCIVEKVKIMNYAIDETSINKVKKMIQEDEEQYDEIVGWYTPLNYCMQRKEYLINNQRCFERLQKIVCKNKAVPEFARYGYSYCDYAYHYIKQEPDVEKWHVLHSIDGKISKYIYTYR